GDEGHAGGWGVPRFQRFDPRPPALRPYGPAGRRRAPPGAAPLLAEAKKLAEHGKLLHGQGRRRAPEHAGHDAPASSRMRPPVFGLAFSLLRRLGKTRVFRALRQVPGLKTNTPGGP